MTLSIGRDFDDKAVITGTYTKPLSDFLRETVPTFSFAFPFVGNRADTTGTPVDSDFIPLTGVDALLQGAGLVGTAWGSGVGHSYVFGATNLVSALVYVNGMRLELKDCRVSSLELAYTPGQIPVATATLEVGSVKNVAASAVPGTLTWNEQATVSASPVETVAHTWKNARGFSDLTITIAPDITDIPDSNATDGVVKEVEARTTTIAGTMFSDDTSSDEIFDHDQAVETVEGNLETLSFTVGDAAVGSDPALAHTISIPLPELHESGQEKLGSKAATSVTGVARGAAAGSGNDELEIIWI